MFCPKCGKQVDDSDAFCRWCGRPLSAEKPAVGGAPPSTAAPGPAGKAEEPMRRSGQATASLILGLFSFVPPVGLLAVIFGHLALADIRRSRGRLLGEGMAVFGLVVGYVSLGVWVIIGLSALVKPVLPSSRRAADRQLTLLRLRTINTAATTYAAIYEHGYPPSLAALGPPRTGNPNASVTEIVKAENDQAAGLIDQVLASGTVGGYRFTYVAGEGGKRGQIRTYAVHADPVAPGERIHYFTDETGVIRQEEGKEANAHSPPCLGASGGQPAAGYKGGPKEKPQWEFAEHPSPMDETKTQMLRMEAVDTDLPGYRGGTLIIRCKGGKTDLYVVTGMPAEVEYGTDTNTVRIRLDDRKPVTQHWTESDDHEALFAPNPIGLAEEIAAAQTMLFEFTPFRETKKVIRFDLEGLKSQIERVSIPCKWSKKGGAEPERAEAQAEGEVVVITWPQGAWVSIDGEGFDESLKTPLTIRLAPGRHQINVTKVGYVTGGKEVLIKPGGTTNLEITLEKMPY
jgi:type II secretory pathway pseudopilin PulG